MQYRQSVKPVVAWGVLFAWLTPSADAAGRAPVNLAAAVNGAKASSNGDMVDPRGLRYSADKAIDGVRYWYDEYGAPTGLGWMSDKEHKVNDRNPAVWQVTLSRQAKVNKAVIYHLKYDGELVDFELAHWDPQAGAYKRVVPSGEQWTNPVRDNHRLVNTLRFETVTTDRLQLTITKAGPGAIAQTGGKGGTAYVAEFEAYYEPDEARAAQQEAERMWVRQLSDGAKAWRQDRQKREAARRADLIKAQAEQSLSPVLAWTGKEKIRTSHTPVATGKLIEYADQFRAAGFNSHMLASWHWDARASKVESDLRRLNEMARKKGFRLIIWTAWYWYPDNKDGFFDRNAFSYLGKDYRGAVDFQGTRLKPTPCPFAEELWKSMVGQAVQVAEWSTRGGLKSIVGYAMDFEHYGAPNGRSFDSYNYDKCFCEDCFGKFLKAIDSSIEAEHVCATDRYQLLKQAGALEAYYELLCDRARVRAEELRKAAHAVNPDLLLGFYGIFPTLEVFETSLDDLPKKRFMASWFGEALFKGLGTKRVPSPYLPLITDPSWNPFYAKFDELVKYFRDNEDVHVLYCPGFVIAPEQPSAFMRKGIVRCLADADGFFFNELWMLWAYKEDPKKASPSWVGGKAMEPVGNYWNAIRTAVNETGYH